MSVLLKVLRVLCCVIGLIVLICFGSVLVIIVIGTLVERFPMMVHYASLGILAVLYGFFFFIIFRLWE